jgi:hypothetical protein
MSPPTLFIASRARVKSGGRLSQGYGSFAQLAALVGDAGIWVSKTLCSLLGTFGPEGHPAIFGPAPRPSSNFLASAADARNADGSRTACLTSARSSCGRGTSCLFSDLRPSARHDVPQLPLWLRAWGVLGKSLPRLPMCTQRRT